MSDLMTMNPVLCVWQRPDDLTGFWMLWMLLIIFCCFCVFRHRRIKLRTQQEQRQREINLIAYNEACTYPSSMLDLSTSMYLTIVNIFVCGKVEGCLLETCKQLQFRNVPLSVLHRREVASWLLSVCGEL